MLVSSTGNVHCGLVGRQLFLHRNTFQIKKDVEVMLGIPAFSDCKSSHNQSISNIPSRFPASRSVDRILHSVFGVSIT